LLLTERTGNGLLDLFTPGEHLAVYEPEDLVEQAAYYLAAPRERERIGRAGARLVAARHTMAARMATVTDWLAAGVVRRDTVARAASSYGVAAQLTIARGLCDPAATMRLAAERLQAAALAGGDVDAAIALAEIMLYTGRDDGALTLLALARDARPDDPRPWLLAGEIERRRGRLAEALALFRDGVAAARIPAAVRAAALAALTDPAGAEAWFALGLVLQAVGLPFVPGFVRQVGVGLPRTALDYFQRSLALAPHAPRIAEQIAAVLELAGRDEFARPFREGLVGGAPADPEVRARFARVLRRSYALSESEHHARVALVLAGRDGMTGAPAAQAAAYREAGLALLQAGQPARAARALEQAVALAPSMADVRTDAAIAHLESGDLAAARRHLEGALAAAPAEPARLAALLALVQERVARSSPPV
jgi:tetratricopeptide (TPR) repeat protein